jgi:predicted MFS family arabinose efflux permease
LSLPLMLIIGLTGWLPLAAVLYPLRQGLMDMSAGILQVFSMEVVAERHRGIANSSYQAAYQAANGLATPIGGLIIAHLGYPPVFILAAILYMAALTLLWGRFGQRGSTN